MYANKDNNFFHGIMFHHFHDDGIHTKGQGSLDKDEFNDGIVKKYLEKEINLNKKEFDNSLLKEPFFLKK